MKAKKWQFKNVYVYRPGIAEWIKKYPALATFKGNPLSDQQPELEKSEQEYKKHTVSTKEFLRLSKQKNTIVLDVRELSNRDQFPIQLPNIKHYPVDRLVKLIRSGSRKVQNKQLLILDNCGNQAFWLQDVLTRAGLQDYHFLGGGVVSWHRDGYDRYGRLRAGGGR